MYRRIIPAPPCMLRVRMRSRICSASTPRPDRCRALSTVWNDTRSGAGMLERGLINLVPNVLLIYHEFKYPIHC